MSVILESQVGDEIVCIEEFHASPDGNPFSWDTSSQFRVGERLRYQGSRLDPHFKELPNGWLVVFKASDGKLYAATQTYFVTLECWKGIKKQFARRLLVEPKRAAKTPG
jgi:hypothetical protein